MIRNKVIIIGNPLHNTYGIARSLSRCGINVILILEPTRFLGIKYSKYVSKVHVLDKLENLKELLLSIYGNEPEKPILLCGSDPSVSFLDLNFEALKDKFIFFNAGESGKINYYMDKINTFSIAEKYGFAPIKSWYVSDIHNLPHNITYPCLIKGNNSIRSTKKDMLICETEEDLRKSLKEGIEYLIQEYIPKEYELDIVGLAYNGGKDVFVPGVVRKIRDEIHRQSVFIRLDDISDYSNLDVSKLKGFIQELCYEGIFSVEVIYSRGKYYFLEVNLRNDGCGWIYTAAGINYPYLWVLYGQNKLTADVLNGLKIKTPLYLMHEDDLYNLFEGKVSLRQWLSDFHKTEAFFDAYLKDPLKFFYGFAIHVRQGCKLVLRKILKIQCN